MISYSTKGIVWHIFNPLENDADIWNLQVFNLQAFKHGFYNSSHILKINLNGIAGFKVLLFFYKCTHICDPNTFLLFFHQFVYFTSNPV